MAAVGPKQCLALSVVLYLLWTVTAAPVEEGPSHALQLSESITDVRGCYYNFEHYGEGDRILTNEPCLNCTCHNRMLMCYLRVCPFTKAIGQDCTVEKKPDQCCPIITCPQVPVALLTSSTTSETPLTTTALGRPDNYGCILEDNTFYADGAQVPSDPRKPCELCYCIRNHTACVMQECTLNVEGCKPVYQEGICCPVRYDCDYDEVATTPKPTIGLVTTPGGPSDCLHNGHIYHDGAMVMKDEKAPCEHCYCMRGDIVCAVQECGTPLEGTNCIPMEPKHGQCCPNYKCANETYENESNLPSSTEKFLESMSESDESEEHQSDKKSSNESSSDESKEESQEESGSEKTKPITNELENNSHEQEASSTSVPEQSNVSDETSPLSSSHELSTKQSETADPVTTEIPLQENNIQQAGDSISEATQEQDVTDVHGTPNQEKETTNEQETAQGQETTPKPEVISEQEKPQEDETTQKPEVNQDQGTIQEQHEVSSEKEQGTTQEQHEVSSEKEQGTAQEQHEVSSEKEQGTTQEQHEVSSEKEQGTTQEQHEVSSEKEQGTTQEQHEVSSEKEQGTTQEQHEVSSEKEQGTAQEQHEVSSEKESQTQTPAETEKDQPVPNEIPESTPTEQPGPVTEEPAVEVARIPGEGSCLVEGKTYAHNSVIPTENPCQESCQCHSSIVSCKQKDCPPAPTQFEHCMPVTPPGSCCPTYMCDQKPSDAPEAQNQLVEKTDDVISPENDNGQIETTPATIENEHKDNSFAPVVEGIPPDNLIPGSYENGVPAGSSEENHHEQDIQTTEHTGTSADISSSNINEDENVNSHVVHGMDAAIDGGQLESMDNKHENGNMPYPSQGITTIEPINPVKAEVEQHVTTQGPEPTSSSEEHTAAHTEETPLKHETVSSDQELPQTTLYTTTSPKPSDEDSSHTKETSNIESENGGMVHSEVAETTSHYGPEVTDAHQEVPEDQDNYVPTTVNPHLEMNNNYITSSDSHLDESKHEEHLVTISPIEINTAHESEEGIHDEQNQHVTQGPIEMPVDESHSDDGNDSVQNQTDQEHTTISQQSTYSEDIHETSTERILSNENEESHSPSVPIEVSDDTQDIITEGNISSESMTTTKQDVTEINQLSSVSLGSDETVSHSPEINDEILNENPTAISPEEGLNNDLTNDKSTEAPISQAPGDTKHEISYGTEETTVSVEPTTIRHETEPNTPEVSQDESEAQESNNIITSSTEKEIPEDISTVFPTKNKDEKTENDEKLVENPSHEIHTPTEQTSEGTIHTDVIISESPVSSDEVHSEENPIHEISEEEPVEQVTKESGTETHTEANPEETVPDKPSEVTESSIDQAEDGNKESSIGQAEDGNKESSPEVIFEEVTAAGMPSIESHVTEGTADHSIHHINSLPDSDILHTTEHTEPAKDHSIVNEVQSASQPSSPEVPVEPTTTPEKAVEEEQSLGETTPSILKVSSPEDSHNEIPSVEQETSTDVTTSEAVYTTQTPNLDESSHKVPVIEEEKSQDTEEANPVEFGASEQTTITPETEININNQNKDTNHISSDSSTETNEKFDTEQNEIQSPVSDDEKNEITPPEEQAPDVVVQDPHSINNGEISTEPTYEISQQETTQITPTEIIHNVIQQEPIAEDNPGINSVEHSQTDTPIDDEVNSSNIEQNPEIQTDAGVGPQEPHEDTSITNDVISTEVIPNGDSSVTSAPLETTQETLVTIAPVEIAQDVSQTNAPVEIAQDVSQTNAPDEIVTDTPTEITQDVEVTNRPVEISQDTVVTNAPVEITQDTEVTNAPVEITQDTEVTNAPVEITQDAEVTNAPVYTTQENPDTHAPVETTHESDGQSSEIKHDAVVTNAPDETAHDMELTSSPVEISQDTEVTKEPEQDSTATQASVEIEENDEKNEPVHVTHHADVTNAPYEITQDTEVTNAPVEITQDPAATIAPIETIQHNDETNAPLETTTDSVTTKSPIETTHETLDDLYHSASPQEPITETSPQNLPEDSNQTVETMDTSKETSTEVTSEEHSSSEKPEAPLTDNKESILEVSTEHITETEPEQNSTPSPLTITSESSTSHEESLQVENTESTETKKPEENQPISSEDPAGHVSQVTHLENVVPPAPISDSHILETSQTEGDTSTEATAETTTSKQVYDDHQQNIKDQNIPDEIPSHHVETEEPGSNEQQIEEDYKAPTTHTPVSSESSPELQDHESSSIPTDIHINITTHHPAVSQSVSTETPQSTDAHLFAEDSETTPNKESVPVTQKIETDVEAQRPEEHISEIESSSSASELPDNKPQEHLSGSYQPTDQSSKVPTVSHSTEAATFDEKTSTTHKPSLAHHEVTPSFPTWSQKPFEHHTTPEPHPPEESHYPSGFDPEYEDEEGVSYGPGTCRYGGKVYLSAQQIPRDDPCDFCFCFRSDIICLQQSCPPPIRGCYQETIKGFCCPRYECHVSMATMLNITTTTTTTTTTLPPHFFAHAYNGAATKAGCQVKDVAYSVGERIPSTSGPCLECRCGANGQMKCDPTVCGPQEALLRQVMDAAISRRR